MTYSGHLIWDHITFDLHRADPEYPVLSWTPFALNAYWDCSSSQTWRGTSIYKILLVRMKSFLVPCAPIVSTWCFILHLQETIQTENGLQLPYLRQELPSDHFPVLIWLKHDYPALLLMNYLPLFPWDKTLHSSITIFFGEISNELYSLVPPTVTLSAKTHLTAYTEARTLIPFGFHKGEVSSTLQVSYHELLFWGTDSHEDTFPTPKTLTCSYLGLTDTFPT